MSYRDDLEAFLRRQAADRESEELHARFDHAQRARRRRTRLAAGAAAGALVGALLTAIACWPAAEPSATARPPLRALRVKVLDSLCREHGDPAVTDCR